MNLNHFIGDIFRKKGIYTILVSTIFMAGCSNAQDSYSFSDEAPAEKVAVVEQIQTPTKEEKPLIMADVNTLMFNDNAVKKWNIPNYVAKKPLMTNNTFEYSLLKGSTTKNTHPVFYTTSHLIFKNKLGSVGKDERLKKLSTAMMAHDTEQPPGWDKNIEAVKSETSELEKLKIANNIINKIPYKDGTDGTYYSPLKFYNKGGVCKDFATAKYILLRDSGYPVDKLRVAVLTPKWDKPDSPLHVVLVAEAEGKPYVLDLLPSYLAEQERTKLKTTKEKQISQIREAGLDITDIDSGSSKGFSSLTDYKSDRGLMWLGNENGVLEKFTELPQPVEKVAPTVKTKRKTK